MYNSKANCLGKTLYTEGRIVDRLVPLDSGEVLLPGRHWPHSSPAEESTSSSAGEKPGQCLPSTVNAWWGHSMGRNLSRFSIRWPYKPSWGDRQDVNGIWDPHSSWNSDGSSSGVYRECGILNESQELCPLGITKSPCSSRASPSVLLESVRWPLSVSFIRVMSSVR